MKVSGVICVRGSPDFVAKTGNGIWAYAVTYLGFVSATWPARSASLQQESAQPPATSKCKALGQEVRGAKSIH